MTEKCSLHPIGFNYTTDEVYDWAKKVVGELSPYRNIAVSTIQAFLLGQTEYLQLQLAIENKTVLLSIEIPLTTDTTPTPKHRRFALLNQFTGKKSENVMFLQEIINSHGAPDMVEAIHMMGIVTQSLGLSPTIATNNDLPEALQAWGVNAAEYVRSELGDSGITGQIFPYRIDGTEGSLVLALDLWATDDTKKVTSAMLGIIGFQEYGMPNLSSTIAVQDAVTAMQMIGILCHHLDIKPTIGKLTNETNPYCTAPWVKGQTNGDLLFL